MHKEQSHFTHHRGGWNSPSGQGAPGCVMMWTWPVASWWQGMGRKEGHLLDSAFLSIWRLSLELVLDFLLYHPLPNTCEETTPNCCPGQSLSTGRTWS